MIRWKILSEAKDDEDRLAKLAFLEEPLSGQPDRVSRDVRDREKEDFAAAAGHNSSGG